MQLSSTIWLTLETNFLFFPVAFFSSASSTIPWGNNKSWKLISPKTCISFYSLYTYVVDTDEMPGFFQWRQFCIQWGYNYFFKFPALVCEILVREIAWSAGAFVWTEPPCWLYQVKEMKGEGMEKKEWISLSLSLSLSPTPSPLFNMATEISTVRPCADMHLGLPCKFLVNWCQPALSYENQHF